MELKENELTNKQLVAAFNKAMEMVEKLLEENVKLKEKLGIIEENENESTGQIY